ncbi:ascorbate oxidase [Ilyonectria sp. MPI-CAGE-AT-0026]|nr:ascorbate oxidase [Ilyonectria sp. MPI-CAGE-AT-0026]
MLALIFYALLFQWLILPVAPELVKHDSSVHLDHILRVTTQNIAVACQTRLSTVVNGTSPGPELRIKPGETTWIRVYNDMESQNLTMHWHGLAQRTAVFSDGSPQGSQWAIPPGHFFDYELHPELGDSGTYFYHSHVGVQAITASGPLIVEDCGKPPYHYDEERILQWNDFFNQTDEQLEAGLEAVPFVWTGETQGVLLNGQGISIGHNSTGVASCTLPVIDVSPGKTYRFRFIGSTGLSLLSMAFEGHDQLSIIQVDGGEWTKPAPVDRIQLASGQRFDTLFVAKTKKQLKAEKRKTYFLQFETRDRPTVYRGYAVLRYSDSAPLPEYPVQAPLSLPNTTYDWLEYQLQPLYPKPVGVPTLAEVTRRVIMDAVQMMDPNSNQLVWRLAGLSWTDKILQKPLLVDIYLNGEAAMPDYDAALRNNGWDPKTKAFPAKVGEVLEIVFQNRGSLSSPGKLDSHPFHAHGQHFYDIGSGNGTYDAEANEKKLAGMGYRVVQRDTTMLYRYELATAAGAGAPAGWRAWRIRVKQPGVWMIHCHTLQHMVMGMQSAWVIGTAPEILEMPLDESQGYLVYGGDAYGNATYDPTCRHQFGNEKTCKDHWP